MAPPHMTRLTSRVARVLLLAGLATATLPATAATQVSITSSPNQAVPDGNASGLVSVLDVSPGLGRILDIDISLTLSDRDFGGWNGDLYVLLSHGDASSVLINRPGLTSTDPFGYGDNGLFNARFDDAATGDIHLYQEILGTSDSVLPLDGTWQPDGRATDPDSVLDTDPRTLLLDEFNGQVADGEWRLFIADLSRGGAFQLESWTLHLTT